MKTSELIKVLKSAGCKIVEHGKEHDKWFSTVSGNYFRVPRHGAKELASGTVNSILKQAGLK